MLTAVCCSTLSVLSLSAHPPSAQQSCSQPLPWSLHLSLLFAHLLTLCMMPLLVPCCRRFKLGDFGLAIDTNLERSKSRVGTLDYMSPEVGRPGHCANTT